MLNSLIVCSLLPSATVHLKTMHGSVANSNVVWRNYKIRLENQFIPHDAVFGFFEVVLCAAF